MQIERETLVEIGVSVLAIGAFVAVMLGIGAAFGGNELTETGALALIAAIVGFVLLMTVVGVGLERRGA